MAEIQIQRTYPRAPDGVAKLVEAVQGLARDIAVNGGFTGSHVSREEPGVTVRFSTLEEFAALPIEALDFDLHAGGYGAEPSVGLRLGYDKTSVILTVSVPADRKTAALAAVTTFEATSGLQPFPENANSGPQPQRVSFRRAYRPGTARPDTLVGLYKQHIAPFAGGTTSVDVTTDPGDRRLHLADVKLLTTVPEGMRRLGLRTDPPRYPGGSASFDLDVRDRPRLEIEIQGPLDREHDALAAFDAFEAASSLRPVDEDQLDEARTGRAVTYFAKEPIGTDWLDRLLSVLRKDEPYARWPLGRLQFRDEVDEHAFSDIDLLVAAAKRRWADLLEFQLHYNGERSSTFVLLEPKAWLVRLELKAATDAAALAALGRLSEALNLEPWPHKPYAEIKARHAWRFRTLDRQKYADALDDLVAGFVSRDPIVWQHKTYVAESNDLGALSFQEYSRLSSFLERIRDKRPFAEAKLTVAGPRDTVVSFLVVTKKPRLEVRSRLTPTRVQDLTAALEDKLALRRMDAPDGDESKDKEATKTFLQQLWRFEGLPAKLVTGLAIAITSAVSFGVGRLTSQDRLAIVRPQSTQGKVAVDAGCIPFEWSVTERSTFDDGRTLINELGRVRVDAGGGGQAETINGFRSGDGLYLPAGTWNISVYDETRRRLSDSITVTATAPSAAATTNVAAKQTMPGKC